MQKVIEFFFFFFRPKENKVQWICFFSDQTKKTCIIKEIKQIFIEWNRDSKMTGKKGPQSTAFLHVNKQIGKTKSTGTVMIILYVCKLDLNGIMRASMLMPIVFDDCKS